MDNRRFWIKSALLLTTFVGCGSRLFAADVPRGTVLELHSCELYAGGCVISSQATLEGRYLLTAWKFTGGQFRGIDLAGLQAAVLQASSENLAAPTSDPGSAVVYLPANATEMERAAVLGFLKESQPGLQHGKLATRAVPLRFTKEKDGYAFSAGDFLHVSTASLESCETGACGEALWYQPRTPTSVFTVALNRASKVVEPLLSLKWNDAGKRSIFVGKFGLRPQPAESVYVTSTDLCDPASNLF